MSTNSVYQIVTDKIISLLEKDIVPWQRPWVNGVQPTSLISGKGYRGINPVMLNAQAIASGYESNYWITYKQAQARGGQVRKGEKGSVVVFWKWFVSEDEDTGKKKTIPMLRYYTVFNVEQCDGIDYPKPEAVTEFEAVEKAEEIIRKYSDKPKIMHDNGGARYSPSSDYVALPKPEYFHSNHGYYATLFHELVHSTGHTSRCNRFGPEHNHSFASEDYSKEELVAELGAAMLCGLSGINNTIENSAAYIKSWLEALRNDVKMVVMAAAKAQKASDYIQGIKFETEAEE